MATQGPRRNNLEIVIDLSNQLKESVKLITLLRAEIASLSGQRQEMESKAALSAAREQELANEVRLRDERIQSLTQEMKQTCHEKDQRIRSLEIKTQELAREIQAFIEQKTRTEFAAQQLNIANRGMQDQITLLKRGEEEMRARLENLNEENKALGAARDQYKNDFDLARDHIRKVRSLLAAIRAENLTPLRQNGANGSSSTESQG